MTSVDSGEAKDTAASTPASSPKTSIPALEEPTSTDTVRQREARDVSAVHRVALADVAEPAPTPVERNLAEVLAEVVGVEQVSVDSHFFDDLGADSLVIARFCARVRKRADLPPASMRDMYQYPTIRSLATALAHATPSPVEKFLAEVLAEVVGVEQVSVDSHFYDDLGATSLAMVMFCIRVRQRADLPGVTLRAVYKHRTIRSLATALAEAAPTPFARRHPPESRQGL
jgi:acyl carrier protein